MPARRARHAALALLAGAALSAAPGAARANPAAAEALFKEGRRLLKAGQLDEACPKFAESQRLDPSSGTLLNLADCHERQGKVASAWAEFLSASRLASTQGDAARMGEGQRRAARLEPKLSYLTVRAGAAAAPGLVVKRDGEKVEAAQFGSRLPIDPGTHTLSAEAPGRLPFQTSVLVRPNGDDVKVEVPDLAPAPAAPPPAAAPGPRASAGPADAPPPRPAAASRPALGYVLGGVGVAALGVGAVFGVMAVSTYQKADDACPEHKGCSPQAIDDRDRATSQAWIANVGLGVGLVGVAVGGYLLLRSPATPAGAATAGGLMLSPRPGGLTLAGRF
ncbi:MAG TPA: hypothetical protein VFS43_32590 [Polyangiaceae bacterium]|nr:hypothetical protein [Polyangiaceae bacterium]